jgi:hypothetical protein
MDFTTPLIYSPPAIGSEGVIVHLQISPRRVSSNFVTDFATLREFQTEIVPRPV